MSTPNAAGAVVTFGEIMLRLSTPGFERFRQAKAFEARFGGGEANVAASLAALGTPARFVTKLPAHEIGQAAVDGLRALGVDTSAVVRGGARVGLYFLETGASQRPSKVIYDRAGAAVTTLTVDELTRHAGGDLTTLFEGAAWFHWTGITPALGPETRRTLAALIDAAKASGCVVSADLNYRRKLWSVEEARACMRPLMERVDVCIANEEDADKSLGMAAEGADVDRAEIDTAAYFRLAERLGDTFGFRSVAITLRESFSASRNAWSAVLLHDDEPPRRSRVHDLQLVDRVGGGDAFAAGLIHALSRVMAGAGDPFATPADALEFAVAASALKQTIPGDVNLTTEAEAIALARGGGSGRVER